MSKERLLIFSGGVLVGALSACLVGYLMGFKRHGKTFAKPEEHIPHTEPAEENWREEAEVEYDNLINTYYQGSKEVKTHYTPYPISYEDYFDESYEDYDKYALTYYSDDILANSADEVLKDVVEIIGEEALEILRKGDADIDVVYVRDDASCIQYEICVDGHTYADVVGPVPDDDD